jgi:hypothetical protein
MHGSINVKLNAVIYTQITHLKPRATLFYNLRALTFTELLHVKVLLICHLLGDDITVSSKHTAIKQFTINIYNLSLVIRCNFRLITDITTIDTT